MMNHFLLLNAIKRKPPFLVLCMSVFIMLMVIPESFASEEPEPESWTTLSEIPERRTSSAAVTLDEKVYVIGGLNNQDVDTDTVFVYDPDNDTMD